MHHHSHVSRPLLFLIPLVVTSLAASLVHAQPTPPHVFSAGGASAASSNFRVSATVGQPLAGYVGSLGLGGGSRFEVGYWHLAIQRIAGSAEPPVLIRQNWLGQNVPNPFNPMTTISFALAQAGAVRLRVFNLKGERVADLVDGHLPAGRHSLVFRPTELSSGVYFYRLETGGFTESRTLLLLK